MDVRLRVAVRVMVRLGDMVFVLDGRGVAELTVADCVEEGVTVTVLEAVRLGSKVWVCVADGLLVGVGLDDGLAVAVAITSVV